jgi:hypothetical protein
MGGGAPDAQNPLIYGPNISSATLTKCRPFAYVFDKEILFIETSIYYDGKNKGKEVDIIFILNYAFPLLYKKGQFRKIHKKGSIIGH